MFQFSNQADDKVGKQFYHFANKLYPFAKKRLGFDKPCSCILMDDPENAKNPLGYTAYYNPDKQEVVVYSTGRHLKDMLRSFSHELVHHAQACRGDISDQETPEGYAQKDEHMREMEREAYEQGNLIFRDWEDGYKKDLKEKYGEDDYTGSSLGQKNVTYYTSRKMDPNAEAHHRLDVAAHNQEYDNSNLPWFNKFEESLDKKMKRLFERKISPERRKEILSLIDFNDLRKAKEHWIGTAKKPQEQVSYFWVVENKLFYLIEHSTTYGVEIEAVYNNLYNVRSAGLKRLRELTDDNNIQTFERELS